MHLITTVERGCSSTQATMDHSTGAAWTPDRVRGDDAGKCFGFLRAFAPLREAFLVLTQRREGAKKVN
jgi:hypothetical protein